MCICLLCDSHPQESPRRLAGTHFFYFIFNPRGFSFALMFFMCITFFSESLLLGLVHHFPFFMCITFRFLCASLSVFLCASLSVFLCVSQYTEKRIVCCASLSVFYVYCASLSVFYVHHFPCITFPRLLSHPLPSFANSRANSRV